MMPPLINERVHDALRTAERLPGTSVRAGVSEGDLGVLEERLGCYLPAPHRELLRHSNGVELAHGTDHRFGYGPGAPVDIVRWNDPATWKWSWEGIVPYDPEDFVLDHAFGLLGLHRVGVRVLDFNERALRSYAKCGFKVEGREREAALVDGRRYDDVMVGVLASERPPREG